MPVKVLVKGFNNTLAADYKEICQEVLGEILEVRGIQVLTVEYGEDAYIHPETDKACFKIVVGGKSHERAENKMLVPDRLWDMDMPFGNCSICGILHEPSGNGLLVVEPRSRYAVAEIVANTLYILFNTSDNNHLTSTVRSAVFKRIVSEAKVFLYRSLPTLADLAAGMFTAPIAAEWSPLIARLEDYRRELARDIAQTVELESQLEKLAGAPELSDGVLDLIAAVPEVKSVEVRDGTVVLQTHTMYGVHPLRKSIHEFGEFRVELVFGRNASASFRNTKRRVDYEFRSMGHPHVDRAGGHWCQGEGSAILPLLQNFEFLAATLFAIKAIDSVNPAGMGGYLTILSKFPEVTARSPYPKEKAELSERTRKAFAAIFDQTTGNAKVDLENKISEMRQQIKAGQRRVLQAVMMQTLLRQPPISARPAGRRKPRKNSFTLLRDQLEKVRQLEQVRTVDVEGNVLRVNTGELAKIDRASGREFRLGPLAMEFSFSNGEMRIRNEHPIRMPDGRLLQAPNVPSADGLLPVSQMSATLPELLGGMELETAVALCWEFLGSFDPGTMPAEAQRQLQKVV